MSTLLPELCNPGGSLDPQKLLDFIEFPLDNYDLLLRKNKVFRLRALFQQSIPILDQSFNVSKDPTFTQSLRRLAAILTIQTAWRGYWTMFKYSCVKFGDLSLHVFDATSERSETDLPIFSSFEEDTMNEVSRLPDHSLMSTALQWSQKYQNYITLCEASKCIPPCFDEFCIIKIQATWKMYLVRKSFKVWKQTIHQGGLKPHHDWLEKFKRKNVPPSKLDEDTAAARIQNAWKRFRNRKIFFILKDFVSSKEHLHPSRILKHINPREVQLLDPASVVRIRIRLGGYSFPPQIYYKLYNHSSTIDLNSFSPRNYVNPLDTEKSTWYKRFENNGWRPLLSSLNPYDVLDDPIFLLSTYRRIKYPTLPNLRKEEFIKRRKEKRRAWLRHLYKVNMNDLDFEDDEEAHDIVDWSNALDFDAYSNNWFELATSLLETRSPLGSGPADSLLTSQSPKGEQLRSMEPRLSSAKTYRTFESDQLYLP
ncbi:hypothetical protein HMI54_014634 [Coelomomyces lativittatus]|nr:hypothetical protein HMI56_001480 [Coelomomyces lativittatus]KAJ1513868.1 hypothetical protein HMI54_014634 [Coelomomyces lativittatus]